MNYLIEARNQSVIINYEYNRNIINYFYRLLFFNTMDRNISAFSTEFINGNPVEIDDENHVIPYTTFYKDFLSFQEYKDLFLLHCPGDVIYKVFMGLKGAYEMLYADSPFESKDKIKSDDELLKEAKEQLYSTINALEELDETRMFDADYWYDSIIKAKHFPHFFLSENSCTLLKINENTEPFLLNVSIAVTEAYIKLYSAAAEDIDFLDAFQIESYSGDFNNQDKVIFEESGREDLNILMHEAERMKRYLTPLLSTEDV